MGDLSAAPIDALDVVGAKRKRKRISRRRGSGAGVNNGEPSVDLNNIYACASELIASPSDKVLAGRVLELLELPENSEVKSALKNSQLTSVPGQIASLAVAVNLQDHSFAAQMQARAIGVAAQIVAMKQPEKAGGQDKQPKVGGKVLEYANALCANGYKGPIAAQMFGCLEQPDNRGLAEKIAAAVTLFEVERISGYRKRSRGRTPLSRGGRAKAKWTIFNFPQLALDVAEAVLKIGGVEVAPSPGPKRQTVSDAADRKTGPQVRRTRPAQLKPKQAILQFMHQAFIDGTHINRLFYLDPSQIPGFAELDAELLQFRNRRALNDLGYVSLVDDRIHVR